MSVLATLTTLPDALAELEQGALLLLLAEQEGEGQQMARERLARAVVRVQSVRGLVIELLEETGRPPLHVLACGRIAVERSGTA